MKHVSGSVLLIGLLLVGILSVFVLVQLEMLFWYRKAFQSTQTHQNNRIVLEKAVSDLTASFPALTSKSCVSQDSHDPDNSAFLAEAKGCSYEKDHRILRYWVEDLGMLPCVHTKVDGITFSTHHWRITAQIDDVGSHRIQIQTATSAPWKPCESTYPPRVVALGIQSWRQM